MCIAGVSKLFSNDGTEAVLRLSHVPTRMIPAILHMLPGWEIALGFSMLMVWRSRLLMFTGVLTLALMTTFLVHIASIDLSTRCSCLGPMVDTWLGGGVLFALGKNLVLLGLLVTSWCLYVKDGKGGRP